MANRKQKKRRKQRWRTMRFRKGDHAHNLTAAALHWLRSRGGQAVVIGGIGILDESDPLIAGSKGKFQICIGVLGQKPQKRKD